MKRTMWLLLLLCVLLLSGCASLADLPGLSTVEEIASPEDRFVEIGSYSMHYSSYDSSADAPPILFLHGFMSHLHSWDYLAPALADQYSLYGYDRLAFGFSERPLPERGAAPDPYARSQILLRAIGFLDHFGIEKAVIIGNSAGGNLAVQMALEHPDRVQALILIDPAIYRNGPPGFVSALLKLRIFDRIGLKTTRKLAQDPLDLFEDAWYDPEKIPDELLDQYLQPLQIENWDRALYAYTKASSDPGIIKRLQELQLPVLIIHGEQDSIVPLKQSLQLDEELPSSRLEVFDDCGHVPHEECPQQSARVILEFLSSIGYE